jgi:hypothetical protein
MPTRVDSFFMLSHRLSVKTISLLKAGLFSQPVSAATSSSVYFR